MPQLSVNFGFWIEDIKIPQSKIENRKLLRRT